MTRLPHGAAARITCVTDNALELHLVLRKCYSNVNYYFFKQQGSLFTEHGVRAFGLS